MAQFRVRTLLQAFEAEQDRWFLWVPVIFGAGIAGYFSLTVEPGLPVALAPAGLAAVLALLWRSGGLALLLTSSLLAATLGFAAAKLRTWQVAAPVIERPLERVAVSGWIELIEPRPGRGQRVTLRIASMDGMAQEHWPRRVRIRTVEAVTSAKPGDAVRTVASLVPPAGPALPGGFDFSRYAYFLGLGGTGYAREPLTPADLDRPRDRDLAWSSAIERVRKTIGDRITAVLPGETGAIANALITGARGGISDRTNDAYRDSGLFHVLSISGLHMVIMAGSVFFSVRLLLALSPALALRFEIKKWAATAAALGALAYLLISGAAFPTVRSYIMISIMYLAVLLDRPALALRNVAVAALIILAIWPESVIDPGFQMSFAAAVALISAFEAVRNRTAGGTSRRRGPIVVIVLLLSGIVLSTLIASVAVAPIAAYHFQKSQQYAILANLIAIPICNILVMPAALAALVFMPLGLDAWPLALMGLGIDAMTWCAYAVAALPGSVIRLPAVSTAALVLVMSGGLWLALWQRRWRFLGLAPALVGLAIAPMRDAPDVLIARGGGLVAVRSADGRLDAVAADSSSRFELARWLDHDGDGRRPEEALSSRTFRCDWAGCVARLRGEVIAVSRRPAALADDCRLASILIAVGQRAAGCHAASTMPVTETAEDVRPDGGNEDPGSLPSRQPDADRNSPKAGASTSPHRNGANRRRPYVLAEPDLTRGLAHAIYLRRDGTIDRRSVAEHRGLRPWSQQSAGPRGLDATTNRARAAASAGARSPEWQTDDQSP
ncbi:MAG TPA: ComEC/Rec2 family competence protein [Hyphomicrobiaceae bacterium]|nr:ComEC/Rec2 family competence protein [Hyphomicrobiaceae bacterium]